MAGIPRAKRRSYATKIADLQAKRERIAAREARWAAARERTAKLKKAEKLVRVMAHREYDLRLGKLGSPVFLAFIRGTELERRQLAYKQNEDR